MAEGVVATPRRLPVLRRALAESWRAVVAWAVGILAVLALYLPLFPSIGSNGEMQSIIDSLPPQLVSTLGYDDIGTGAGYTEATFFGLMGFVLLTIAGISWGASAIGGAQESGRLELDLAHAVGRVSYALEQALALVVRLAALGAFAGLVILALNGPSELDLTVGGVVWACVALVGLTLASATAALAGGAASGRRVVVVGTGAAVAVVGYLANALAQQGDTFAWLRPFSPYAWAFDSPPLTDPDPASIGLLWLLAAVFAAAAAELLRRRDVG